MRAALAQIEQCEQYLTGKLSPQDKFNFESSMAVNKELKEQVLFQQELMTGIQYAGLKAMSTRAFVIYRRRRRFVRLGLGVTVLLAALLTIYGWRLLNREQGASVESSSQQTPPALFENPSRIMDSDTVENKPVTAVTWSPGESTSIQTEAVGVLPPATDSDTALELVYTEGPLLESREVVDLSLKNDVILDQAQQEENAAEWVITPQTTKEDLKLIAQEIEAWGGTFRVNEIRFRGKLLQRISFVIANSAGEVAYHSPDLGEAGKVCIRLGEKTIAAGWCGGESN